MALNQNHQRYNSHGSYELIIISITMSTHRRFSDISFSSLHEFFFEVTFLNIRSIFEKKNMKNTDHLNIGSIPIIATEFFPTLISSEKEEEEEEVHAHCYSTLSVLHNVERRGTGIYR